MGFSLNCSSVGESSRWHEWLYTFDKGGMPSLAHRRPHKLLPHANKVERGRRKDMLERCLRVPFLPSPTLAVPVDALRNRAFNPRPLPVVHCKHCGVMPTPCGVEGLIGDLLTKSDFSPPVPGHRAERLTRARTTVREKEFHRDELIVAAIDC